jgi:LysM repeat protein
VLEQIYLFATQTAMATQGITTGVPSALETPATVPGAPVVTEAPPPAVVEPPQPALPSPQPILAPSPTPGIPASYTLQTGEFPYCIARRFNVNPGELLRINGLTSYSVYYAGMNLRIPQSGGGFPGSRALRPHPGSYTVRPGDTFYTIACAFGDVDPAMIAFVNNMNANAKPDPGSVINIP